MYSKNMGLQFSSHRDNQVNVSGQDVNEIVNRLVERIRPQSKEFYRKELRHDLETIGESIVDRHAGCGTFYTVTLLKPSRNAARVAR